MMAAPSVPAHDPRVGRTLAAYSARSQDGLGAVMARLRTGSEAERAIISRRRRSREPQTYYE
jgi:hypothetical protein